MPADERLRQADLLDEIGHGGASPGQAPDDPQPVHVGEGLVDDPQLTEILGLVDDRGDGRANAGARGRQEASPVDVLVRAVTSTAIYINRS
jgi:hypothetical protein